MLLCGDALGHPGGGLVVVSGLGVKEPGSALDLSKTEPGPAKGLQAGPHLPHPRPLHPNLTSQIFWL